MELQKLNGLLKACADPTRLRILYLLTRGELCVCDLMEVLRLPQSRVSRHLSYLKEAGMVRDRKEGLWRHYALTPPKGRFHSGLIDCLRVCGQETKALQADLARLEKRRRAKAQGGGGRD